MSHCPFIINNTSSFSKVSSQLAHLHTCQTTPRIQRCLRPLRMNISTSRRQRKGEPPCLDSLLTRSTVLSSTTKSLRPMPLSQNLTFYGVVFDASCGSRSQSFSASLYLSSLEMELSRRWSLVKAPKEIISQFPGAGGKYAHSSRTRQHANKLSSLGVMLGVYTAGISGAHLNPAVTFANCVYRKFPWRKFPGYLIAQVLGAMCASAVVYANYKSAIDVFEGGPDIRTVGSNTSTAGIFCTYPAEFMTKTGQFFSEFIASTILMFCIYALKDDGNLGAGNLTPLGLFFVIFGIGACFGWETGYAINLARDFGPRLTSYMIGYGHEVWSAGGYYFWVSQL